MPHTICSNKKNFNTGVKPKLKPCFQSGFTYLNSSHACNWTSFHIHWTSIGQTLCYIPGSHRFCSVAHKVVSEWRLIKHTILQVTVSASSYRQATPRVAIQSIAEHTWMETLSTTSICFPPSLYCTLCLYVYVCGVMWK